jgi:hypothetical protein
VDSIHANFQTNSSTELISLPLLYSSTHISTLDQSTTLRGYYFEIIILFNKAQHYEQYQE